MGLPGELEGIAEIVGSEAALALAMSLGGRDIRIPKRQATLREGHFLVDAIGMAAARELVEFYGGAALYIPEARRELAASLLNAGMTVADVSARIGRTPASVRRYRRQGRASGAVKT